MTIPNKKSQTCVHAFIIGACSCGHKKARFCRLCGFMPSFEPLDNITYSTTWTVPKS